MSRTHAQPQAESKPMGMLQGQARLATVSSLMCVRDFRVLTHVFKLSNDGETVDDGETDD